MMKKKALEIKVPENMKYTVWFDIYELSSSMESLSKNIKVEIQVGGVKREVSKAKYKHRKFI